MLAHIDKNMSHDAAPKWVQEFTSLLQGNAEDGEKVP